MTSMWRINQIFLYQHKKQNVQKQLELQRCLLLMWNYSQISIFSFFYFSKCSDKDFKVGCVFPTVIWSKIRLWQYWDEDIGKTHPSLLFHKNNPSFLFIKWNSERNEISKKIQNWNFSSRMTFQNFNFSKNIFRHRLVNGNFGTMKRDEFNINQNIIQL